MDNVTHSLAGLVLAESAIRLRARRAGAEPSPRFRSIAALSSLIAANLPDADLVYTGIGGDGLRYMLHHRGYTHTVVMAVIGAALMWGAALLVWRWQARASPARDDARWLAALLLAGTLSHLVLDWTNSYGVHLFWPLDERWAYGDAVFIVEPWFWAVSVPMLVASATSRIARVLLSLILGAGLLLVWRVDLASTGAATALTVGAALSVLLARMLRPGPRAAVAVAGWIAVTLVMATGATIARQAAVRAARAESSPIELLDVAVTPLPANAVCMSVISVERSGSTYRVMTARASAAPWIADAARCGARRGAGPMFRVSSRPSTREVHWDNEWTAPETELATLARESCPARAALRFIRVPVWRRLDDSSVVLGDARFGGGSGRGFSDVVVPRRSAVCPSAVPPWIPPRADLLAVHAPPSAGSSGKFGTWLHLAATRVERCARIPSGVRCQTCTGASAYAPMPTSTESRWAHGYISARSSGAKQPVSGASETRCTRDGHSAHPLSSLPSSPPYGRLPHRPLPAHPRAHARRGRHRRDQARRGPPHPRAHSG